MIRFSPYNVYGKPDAYSPVIRLTLKEAKEYAFHIYIETLCDKYVNTKYGVYFAILYGNCCIGKCFIKPDGIYSIEEV